MCLRNSSLLGMHICAPDTLSTATTTLATAALCVSVVHM